MFDSPEKASIKVLIKPPYPVTRKMIHMKRFIPVEVLKRRAPIAPVMKVEEKNIEQMVAGKIIAKKLFSGFPQFDFNLKTAGSKRACAGMGSEGKQIKRGEQ